jgi:peptide/nickel transport system ATP-binding protein
MTATGPLLSVRDLKTYFIADEGTTRAIDGATFDIQPGSTLGVVGETGCGKSVTARSILRIVERPGKIVGGEILLQRSGGYVDLTKLDPDGREMRRVRGGEIGLIFQEPMTSFSPVHTVGDQIIEAIRLHRRFDMKQARARTIELFKLVGISRPEGRLEEYSWQLSGGLRQRAMIAMALAAEPRLLIADEPTTALDVTTQAQILELLSELQRKTHMAIMLITHDLGVVAEMADDVVVMYLGRVVENGPVDQIFHAPRHPYTRALLRSMPGIQQEARVTLPTIAGSIPHPFARPAGCPFHPRCTSAMDCKAATDGVCCCHHIPELTQIEEGQCVSCHLYRTAGTVDLVAEPVR